MKFPITDETQITFRNNLNPSESWNSWKLYKDCNETEKEQFNLASWPDSCILFDKDFSDEITHEKIIQDYEDFKKKLDAKGITSFLAYESRKGYHVLAKFKSLDKYSEEARKEIAKLYIKEFDCDSAKAMNTGLVAVDGRNHFKTGIIYPILFDNIEGENQLDERIVAEARKIVERNEENSKKFNQDQDFKDYFETDSFFQFIKNNVLPDGRLQRDMIVMPNLAAAAAKTGKTEDEIENILHPIIEKNFPGKQWGEMRGWLRKGLNGELNYNPIQLNDWGKTFFSTEFYDLNPISVDSASFTKEIVLPKTNRLISEFAEELAMELKNTHTLFFRTDSRQIVEIGAIKQKNEEEESYTGFIAVNGGKFITLAETFVIPGILEFNKDTDDFEFKRKSMSRELANTTLQSHILEDALPRIDTIFTIPKPVFVNGKLEFPKPGYDKKFKSWLPYDAPKIDVNMSLDEAKKIMHNIYREFCFQSHEDYTIAIAALLTPFLRGLYSSHTCRTPLFVYLGNRPRTGKDYAAAIRSITYEGVAIEEPPISTNDGGHNEELRKKIMAALIGGKNMLHFSNNKGLINNPVLEGFITSENWSDRVLGENKTITFRNNIEISISGNVGLQLTSDLEHRSRFIKLEYSPEDINARVFENPNLHEWVLQHRSEVISALYALVRNWFDKGCPNGTIPFASFPEWARVCGGIMEAAGYNSPCKPDKTAIAMAGDSTTNDMRMLFESCYDKYPDKPLRSSQIRDVAVSEGIFNYYDFNERPDQTKFGNTLISFINRELSGILMLVLDRSVRSSRYEYIFTKKRSHETKSEIFYDIKQEELTKFNDKDKKQGETTK